MSHGTAPLRGNFAELYEELRRLAHAQLRRGGTRPTLNTTAVVHEAYLKLAGATARWEGEEHFLSLAARVMRQVVVDYARAQSADKRGGERRRVPLGDPATDTELPIEELLDIDRSLVDLEQLDERLARIVNLRFFAGLNHAEIATVLRLSERTIESDWRRARVFLLSSLARTRDARDES
jgi:RNA polymerase sigma factor (TIGR02999 family)